MWGDTNNYGYGNGGADLDAITEIPYYQFGDSIYIELGNSSWEEAQANAEKLGGNLVSINSQEEQEFIYENFIANDNSGDIGKWIGFTDKDQEGNWKWTDGSNVGLSYLEF